MNNAICYLINALIGSYSCLTVHNVIHVGIPLIRKGQGNHFNLFKIQKPKGVHLVTLVHLIRIG